MPKQKDVAIIEQNIRKILDFYYKNDNCFPGYDAHDAEETKLYDFERKINLSCYDIDDDLLKEYETAKKEAYKNKGKRKKIRSLQKKQYTITNAINNYYNYYLENGYFPTNSKSSSEEEIRISRAYTTILTMQEIYTDKHREMMDIINEIKENRKNRLFLKTIKQYVDFCYKYERRPKRTVNAPAKDDITGSYEYSLAKRFSDLDLSNVKIPKRLWKRYITAEKLCDDKEKKESKDKVNTYMRELISFMKKHSATAYERQFRKYQIECNGTKVYVHSALNFILKDDNINLVNDELIETYNSFDFVKRKLEKTKYNLTRCLYRPIFPTRQELLNYSDVKDSLKKLEEMLSKGCVMIGTSLIKILSKKEFVNPNITSSFDCSDKFITLSSNDYEHSLYLVEDFSWMAYVNEVYPGLMLDIKVVEDNELLTTKEETLIIDGEMQMKGDIAIDYLMGICIPSSKYIEYYDENDKCNKNVVQEVYRMLKKHNINIPVVDIVTGNIISKD